MTTGDPASISTPDDVRRELGAFIDREWNDDLTVGEWWERLAGSGWATPHWPVEWHGLGLPRDLMSTVSAVLADKGALGPPAGLGMLLAGPTILAHGDDAQKKRYLWPIVTGQEAWCQLFSEPGAGSDLAAVQTKGTKDGDEWIFSGQKVWTSAGHIADLGMLLARTDPDVPKHAGISYFALSMDQPGVDVRPLREMTGRALFTEVFIDEARASDSTLLGGLNNGWRVANTTLANERLGLGAGGGGAGGGAHPGAKAGALETRAGDHVGGGGHGGTAATAMAGRAPEQMQKLAQLMGKSSDPVIRQDLMRLYSYGEIGKYTMLRMRAAKAAGRGPGPEANTAKLAMSRMTRMTRDLAGSLGGAHATLWGKDGIANGGLAEMMVFSPAVSIYGGSDQIQRNIIGERVLGLPKEPRADVDVPFKDLKVGTQPD